jgi:uncharacterized protein
MFRRGKDSPADSMDAIADTGYLVALVRQHDRHHTWANGVAGQFDLPLLTCEAVLAETAFHLKSSLYVFAMLRRGAVRVAFDLTGQLERLHDLAERYEDRNPDLADLCLICMSELYPRHTVVTVDEEDFRVYRRNKREAIPLLCPPQK